MCYEYVEWVNYVGLFDYFDYLFVVCYLLGCVLGILMFGVKGGCDGGVKF